VWLPLRRVAELEPLTPQREAALRARGADDATIAEIANAELWKNNLYVVTVTRHALGFVTELSIRRVDRTHITDWRHKQRIKNEIAGEEVEAMELYPAMSRLMDTANQAYLWATPCPPTWSTPTRPPRSGRCNVPYPPTGRNDHTGGEKHDRPFADRHVRGHRHPAQGQRPVPHPRP
jgi:hypothetical protein